MAYSMLQRSGGCRSYVKNSLEEAALSFLRESCEGLRFDAEKAARENPEEGRFLGKALKENQIPFNMQMDIDRLCLEVALERFLRSGQKEDAFDVYFCYLEMFVGDYKKTRRMIELLSEFEANGSGLLMKHRDHYVHSVYVFALGLAVYQTNDIFRGAYGEYYAISEPRAAACHFLEFWGLTSLFHDIGYPFELPFEQVASYFEVDGDKRNDRPFVAYRALESFCTIERPLAREIAKLYGNPSAAFDTTDELFAYDLSQKLSGEYLFSREQMLRFLRSKPTHPETFNHFMDHAYFSATVLFVKLFGELHCPLRREHIDALGAIMLHNSLYKFCIAHYKDDRLNIPLKIKQHPLAYLLMLCDELQCWDRVAYGRRSRQEVHPFGCTLDFSGNGISLCYLYDEQMEYKFKAFHEAYDKWVEAQPGQEDRKAYKAWEEKRPSMKAYSEMLAAVRNEGGRQVYVKSKEDGVSLFQADIERIVDLSAIPLKVTFKTECKKNYRKNPSYISNSNFVNLYAFAVVLNGRWSCIDDWKKARANKTEEAFLLENQKRFEEDFPKMSLEYKLSNINQAKGFARYLEAIDCFYTDKAVDFEMLEHFAPEQLNTIGAMEHQRWLQEHFDMGWDFIEFSPEAKAGRERNRLHWDMIPTNEITGADIPLSQARAHHVRLNGEEQDKDTEPMECMLSMLRLYDGVRIYRLK